MKILFFTSAIIACSCVSTNYKCKWIGLTITQEKNQTLKEAYTTSKSWGCLDKDCYDYNVLKSRELALVNKCRLIEVIVKHDNGYEVLSFIELRAKIF